ncbi:AraC family transcriptional regulator [Williamsia limnetica]|uniref:HTH-type transcriptional regulator RipA n=1 Tax=Williamsia limnetica TaxID=882452 RepID=A0A318RPG8_WILLI|nr:AraC family transcriptional regulator [Williamsia limnetica]PYE18058.1 AraC family transcriptional regulator [Williamsia limnetica]
MTLGGHFDKSGPAGPFGAGADPLWVEEYGYGLGPPTGILILKYGSGGALEIPESRSDFVHQLYWTPDGMLSVRHANRTEFIGTTEALWVRRGVTHEVFASRKQIIYRICLREVPLSLRSLRVAAVSADQQSRNLIEQIARPGQDEAEALAARMTIMAGLGATHRDFVGRDPIGTPSSSRTTGFAQTIARTLLHDPADPTRLEEWAARLHTSTKTLQRDFVREFGMSYSQWRNRIRLDAAVVLLETKSVTEVAHRVGYSSVPAFVTAFAREYGHTPGRYALGATDSA